MNQCQLYSKTIPEKFENLKSKRPQFGNQSMEESINSIITSDNASRYLNPKGFEITLCESHEAGVIIRPIKPQLIYVVNIIIHNNVFDMGMQRFLQGHWLHVTGEVDLSN
jgi:hypothetical protein